MLSYFFVNGCNCYGGYKDKRVEFGFFLPDIVREYPHTFDCLYQKINIEIEMACTMECTG